MTFIQDREVRLCTPKSTTTDALLRSITAFCVLTEDDSPVQVIPGNYPINEPEVYNATTPIRCYRSPNGDPANRSGLIWVTDLSDAAFVAAFDYTDDPGI